MSYSLLDLHRAFKDAIEADDLTRFEKLDREMNAIRMTQYDAMEIIDFRSVYTIECESLKILEGYYLKRDLKKIEALVFRALTSTPSKKKILGRFKDAPLSALYMDLCLKHILKAPVLNKEHLALVVKDDDIVKQILTGVIQKENLTAVYIQMVQRERRLKKIKAKTPPRVLKRRSPKGPS